MSETDREHEGTEGHRVATIHERSDDTPMGVTVFLTSDELRELGIEPALVDGVRPRIEDGELYLDEV